MSAVIKLDKSKKYSEVKGDRLPDDPHYKVHFWQDDLPFDVGGSLVPDDGKVAPWNALNADGKPVVHHPLWNDLRRKKMEAKLDRMNRVKGAVEEAEEATSESEEDIRKAAVNDINFESWLRGEVQYQPWALFEAAHSRYHKRYSKIPELVLDLVEDEKLVPEDQVCDRLRTFLQRAA